MATISKEEFILKSVLEEEGLTLDKAPTLKALVLKAMEKYSQEYVPKQVKADNSLVLERLHTKRLALSLEKTIVMLKDELHVNYGPGSTNNSDLQEAQRRLDSYTKHHPEWKK